MVWDFGGGTSTEQSPVHTYTADGTYRDPDRYQ